jgi:hypothetical protein
MVKLRRAIIVLSVIWLLGAFAFLVSLNAPWNEFLLLYTFWAVIPVIVINGILWIMKG